MRNDSLDLVMNHLFENPNKRTELKPADQKLLEHIEYCFTLQLSNPLYTDIQVRNALMVEFRMNRQQAYNIMQLTQVALGNVQTAKREWVKYEAHYMVKNAVEIALKGDNKTAQTLIRAAEALGKIYRTDLDDGEVLDAKKYVNIEKVEIVTDPKVINVNLSDQDKEETRKLMEKYHIKFDDDAIQDAEIVNDNEPGLSS